MLPLVTSLPVRRRNAAPQPADIPPDQPVPNPQTPPATKRVEAFDDDVMQNVFAHLNTVDHVVTAPVQAPVEAPDEPLAEARQPVAVAPASTPLPIARPLTPEPAVEPPTGDDSALRGLLAETFGDAIAPVDGPPPPKPPEVAAQSDGELIGILRAAEAAVGDATPPASRRRFRLAIPSLRRAPREAPTPRPARAPLRIPGSTAQQWLALALFLPLPLILFAAAAGTLASLAAFVVEAALTLAQSDLRQLSRTPASRPHRPAPQMPLPPQTLRLIPAAHVVALAAGLFILTGGVAISATGWLLTTLSLALWLAQFPARAARDFASSRASRRRLVGRLIFATLLLPHRPAVQRLVHNRLAATADDPLTADTGESVYSFALSAIPGAIVTGYEMERTLMRPRLGTRPGLIHPHLTTGLMAVAAVVLALIAFGPSALPVMLILALLTEAQLLLADYVAHYGLQRRIAPGGKVDALSPAHHWDAPLALGPLLPRLTGTVAPKPGADGAPVLPHSYPVMALRALIPSRWHSDLDDRVMTMAKRQTHHS